MRDGQGNKLTSDEVAKVRSVETEPDAASLKQVSVDPGPGVPPMADSGKKPEPPETETAPKF